VNLVNVNIGKATRGRERERIKKECKNRKGRERKKG
jgi:hypothetical protein